MFVPEFLYRLSARDEQVTWFDPVYDQVGQSSTGANHVNVSSAVPTGRAWLITHILATGNPAPAENVIAINITLLDPLGTERLRLRDLEQALVGGAIAEALWNGEIMLLPGWTVRSAVSKNAAVSNMISFLNVFGVLIPIGNIQRV